MTANLIDLDAARRERSADADVSVRLNGDDFTLPVEFPVDCFDPFLAGEFDLVGLITTVLRSRDEDSTVDVFVKVLDDQPQLLANGIDAVRAAFSLLFGAEQYATFTSQRPSLQDYKALVQGLVRSYGVGLGEAFASPAQSESDGATPKQTSEPTAPASTPDSSGESAPAETPDATPEPATAS